MAKLPPINYDKLNHLFTKLPFSGKCNDCGQAFDDETYYLCHHPCHQDRYKKRCPPKTYDPNCFQCSLCSKKATNFTNLRYHYQYHAARRFQCLKCEYNAHSLAEVRRHVQKHLDTKLFPCQLCTRQYPDSKSLKEHFIRHHRRDALFICSQCVAPFKDMNQFGIHLDEHYRDAATKGVDPGSLYDLRSGINSSGETVSDAFRVRKKKRRLSQMEGRLPTTSLTTKSSQGQSPRLGIVRDSSFQPNSNKSLLDLVKSQVKSEHGISIPTNRAIKTYLKRQVAQKVSVQQPPPQRINRILVGNAAASSTRFFPTPRSGPRSVTTNTPQSTKTATPVRTIIGNTTNGNSHTSSIKTIDVGTFVPPTQGLADFIETE